MCNIHILYEFMFVCLHVYLITQKFLWIWPHNNHFFLCLKINDKNFLTLPKTILNTINLRYRFNIKFIYTCILFNIFIMLCLLNVDLSSTWFWHNSFIPTFHVYLMNVFPKKAILADVFCCCKIIVCGLRRVVSLYLSSNLLLTVLFEV